MRISDWSSDVCSSDLLCREAGVERLDAGPKGATVAFHKNAFANPAGLIAFIQKQAGGVKMRPDHQLVYRRDWDSESARAKVVRLMLATLVKERQSDGTGKTVSRRVNHVGCRIIKN